MDGAHDQETITRNWGEMLQELRVLQTGVQILTGFLLTVPFSSRFTDLVQRQVTTYLVVLCGATLTTGLVVAPVAFHRVLFRRRLRPWLVAAADLSAKLGLATFALTSSGVLLLVFDVVVGPTPGWVALGVGITFFVVLWVCLPLLGGWRGTRTTPPEA